MKYICLLSLIIFCLCHGQAIAQCNNTLVDKAVSQSGANAVYLRDFKVRLDETRQTKTIPSVKYPVLLSRDMKYRFNVCNAEEFEGKVLLQLYLKDKLIGSTFDTQSSTDLQRFDFECNKSETYEIVMSFDQGKAGCAVGVLSMITEDEVDPNPKELDILYALADNPISIYDDEDQFAQIEVSVDNGYLVKVDKTSYVVHPQKTGMAVLTISKLNRNGTIKEYKQRRFAVLALDKPYATIREAKNGNISKEVLIKSGQIDLWFPTDIKCNYRINSFTVSDTNDLNSGIKSNSGKFSKEQKKWISDLPTGTRLYIKNIKVRTTDYIVMDIDPIEIEID